METATTTPSRPTRLSVGARAAGAADSKYGLCDECDSNQPRFSAYFLRLVDPHGRMLLEGGLAKYDLGWISGRRESAANQAAAGTG